MELTERDARAQAAASDDAVRALIDDAIIDRAARIKRCLDALRAADVPLDIDTAECLLELGERMGVLIQEALQVRDTA